MLWTGHRQRLVDLLGSATRPLAVSDVLRMLPGTAVSTLDRDLALLEEAGAVERLLGIGAVAYFELRDSGGSIRCHLVCHRCGPVADVRPEDGLAGPLLTAAADAARERGFQLRSYRLDVVGLCRWCRRAVAGGPSSPTPSLGGFVAAVAYPLRPARSRSRA